MDHLTEYPTPQTRWWHRANRLVPRIRLWLRHRSRLVYPKCGQNSRREKMYREMRVSAHCGHHFPLDAHKRIEILADSRGILRDTRPDDLTASVGPEVFKCTGIIQALAAMRDARFRLEITNVNGGAIALGRPLGCSGARLMTTLVHKIRRRAPNEPWLYYGLVTLCGGRARRHNNRRLD